MKDFVLVEKVGFYFALIVLILSLILFFTLTGEFLKSFAAALLAAGLGWMSYVIVRWVVLAAKMK